MKLPLSHLVFPPLELSFDDTAALESVASRIVQDLVMQFQTHAKDLQGVVDERRWKKLRQQEQITVYKE